MDGRTIECNYTQNGFSSVYRGKPESTMYITACMNEVMLTSIIYVKNVNKQIQLKRIHMYIVGQCADCNHLLRLSQIKLITPAYF